MVDRKNHCNGRHRIVHDLLRNTMCQAACKASRRIRLGNGSRSCHLVHCPFSASALQLLLALEKITHCNGHGVLAALDVGT